jgi:hypothetical protein
MAWQNLFRPEIFVLLIPIVAILTGGAVAIARQLIRHRERMAMIDRGLHPDYPPEEAEKIEKQTSRQ